MQPLLRLDRSQPLDPLEEQPQAACLRVGPRLLEHLPGALPVAGATARL